MLENKNPECLGDLGHIPNVKISKCRLCDSEDLYPLFSLGEHYVNDFVSKDRIFTGPKCPISLLLCKGCSLVQQEYSAPQELLYTRHYWYYSGTTTTMKDALSDVVSQATETVELKPYDIVLDIGSNDGTLLRWYDLYAPGVTKIGVEPASNMVQMGRMGVDCLRNDFWPLTKDRLILPDYPKVITAIGMFYDLEDPNAFIRDVASYLHKDGVFIAQLMCLKNMLNLKDVGNLAHEHLEFYSLDSLNFLFDRHGLEMFDIERNNVNGESYRLYVRHKGSFHVDRPGGIRRLTEAYMEESGLDNPETYDRFFRQLEKNKNECRRFIHNAVLEGKKVRVVGASTKGNTILQYYGLDHTLIDHASERSPDKVGKYTVGTGIPIYHEEASRRVECGYSFILPYAFKDEIIHRELPHCKPNHYFLIPLPEFKVV